MTLEHTIEELEKIIRVSPRDANEKEIAVYFRNLFQELERLRQWKENVETLNIDFEVNNNFNEQKQLEDYLLKTAISELSRAILDNKFAYKKCRSHDDKAQTIRVNYSIKIVNPNCE